MDYRYSLFYFYMCYERYKGCKICIIIFIYSTIILFITYYILFYLVMFKDYFIGDRFK